MADGSAATVAWLAASGGPGELLLGTADTQSDQEHAVYWARDSDPVFVVRCLMPEWGRCEVEGQRVRIPDGARPVGGSRNLAVVDQRHGWEYDLFQVQSKPRGGGLLEVTWGGRTQISGPGSDGLGSEGTPAQWGQLAGIIRAPELRSGRINHALVMRVKCDSGGPCLSGRR